MDASSRTLRVASACFLVMLSLPAAVHAHPHVFIDVVETIRLDGRGIAGVGQEWRLQGAFGLDIEYAYDLNRDGAFDAAEQASVYDSTFLPLWMENSFFRLNFGDVEYTAVSVEDFSADIVNGEVRFSFYIPCGIYKSAEPVEIETITYDSSIYISFDLYDCRIEGGDGTAYSLEFVPEPGVISHGRDRCGTRVRFGVGAADSAAAPTDGNGLAGNLVPMVGDGPAAPVNPFTGYGSP